jgi:hypothetical protein
VESALHYVGPKEQELEEHKMLETCQSHEPINALTGEKPIELAFCHLQRQKKNCRKYTVMHPKTVEAIKKRRKPGPVAGRKLNPDL